jgi:hypothetical protein
MKKEEVAFAFKHTNGRLEIKVQSFLPLTLDTASKQMHLSCMKGIYA